MSNQELDKRKGKEKSQGRGGERTEPEPHCSTEIRNALSRFPLVLPCRLQSDLSKADCLLFNPEGSS